MRKLLLAVGAVVAALAFGQQAQANGTLPFILSGAGISGSRSISFTPDMISGDPAGANIITSITGRFSDSNVGLSDVNITGLVPTSPNPANAPFATSLSYFSVSGPLLPPIDGGVLS